MTPNQAFTVILNWDAEVLNVIASNPKFVPTVKDATVAIAFRRLHLKCWNPKTGRNW
jgi:hypothetical protein